MPPRRTFQQSLLANLIPALLILGLAVLLVAIASSRASVREMSRSLTGMATARAADSVRSFFDPVRAVLDTGDALLRQGGLSVDDPELLRDRLATVLDNVPHIASVVIAGEDGRESGLFRTPEGWATRLRDPAAMGNTVRFTGPDGATTTSTPEYDPRGRPWFIGALDRVALHPDTDDPSLRTFWSEPYTFFTRQEPGISVSRAVATQSGETVVVSIDVLLADLSKLVQSIEITKRGDLAVVSREGRLIGLPSASPESDLLRTPEVAGLRVLADTDRALTPPGATFPETGTAKRFFSDGRAYWGQIETLSLGDGGRMWIGVWLPESDLVGDVATLRAVTVAVVLLVLLLGIWRAVWLAREYGRPVADLVDLSERISRLDLDHPGRVETQLAELDRLARAHDRMRLSLRQLLRLERDLQVARQIQQATFPQELPKLKGVTIAAWGEPAEETGGDTYDLVGLSETGAARYRVDPDTPEGALVLLADATGHGVGPALSVTQVRSMLRMAVRSAAPLEEIPTHMNEQLREDLTEGRFITAWFGLVNGEEGTVAGLSCGQGPLLVYREATGKAERMSADLPPLGVIPDLEVEGATSVRLESGDIFLAAADGLYEAVNANGDQFGADRAVESLRRCRGMDARGVLDTLRGDLARFTGQTPLRDDCTVIVIRRS